MAVSSFFNRVKYKPASAGTGDFVTSAAVAGFRTPAGASIPDGTLVSYVAFSSDQSEWETGQGAYTSGTTTVARTTIRESSNAGSKVNFTAAPTVALDLQAQDAALLAPLASPAFTGTVTVPTPFTLGAVSVTATGTQLNYLAAAAGTTGTTSTNLVFSTSPTLVTPTLGVATGTSLALSGALTMGTSGILVGGTNLIEQRNAANAQTFRVFNTFTDASNGEWISIDWSSTANRGTIKTKANGTGTNRSLDIISASNLNLGGNDSLSWQIDISSNLAPISSNVRDIGYSSQQVRDIYIGRDIYRPGGAQAIFRTSAGITSGAGALTGTLTNSPVTGNPTSWIPINDNGTTRYIPAW